MLRFASKDDIPQLQALWREAFADSPEYIAGFYNINFSPELAALLELLEKAPEVELSAKNYSQSVNRALGYIHDNLSVKLRIDDICRNVYSARSTLVKKFSEETGMSIGEYINSEVMTICEQLLCETDLPISEISERFGFCDQFYFSRCFKAKYGETPQKYRKNRLI